MVVLKLGDDSDVMARTFDTLNAAEHYADVCASILNSESVEYTEPNQDHEEGEAVSSNNTEANMNNGQDDADSWDDDSEPQTEASALPDEDSGMIGTMIQSLRQRLLLLQTKTLGMIGTMIQSPAKTPAVPEEDLGFRF